MQEQEVINKSDQQLFSHYEIKNWEFSPRIYKIVAASAIFNLLALVVFTQTNILQARACDSPFVSQVCSVLDTVYLGSTLLGTDSEFVSKDYERTELEDAEITYIDVSGDTPPLNYPEGYFALANPEQQFQAIETPNGFGNEFPLSSSPGTTSTIPGMIIPGSDLMNTTPVLPSPNKNPIDGTLPSSPLGISPRVNTPSYRGGRTSRNRPPKVKNESPSDLPKLDGDETADAKDKDKDKEGKTESKQPDVKSESVAEIEINKKPFEDLGDTINAELAKNELDLNQAFEVVMEGTIAADGKLERKKSKFISDKGDEKIVSVVKSAIEAIGDSGFLGYLKNSGVDKVRLTLIQDDKKIYAIIVSDQKTPEKAGSSASGFNTLLSGLKLADQAGLKKLDDNSKTIINNAKITSEGKNFVLNFEIPKPVAQELINKSLKERAEKKNKQTNNSSDLDADSNARLSE